MNYIVTNNRDFFEKIGDYNYCSLEEMNLPKLIAVDTETTDLIPWYGHMFSVQIGTGKDNYLIDLQQIGGELTFEQVIPSLEGKKMVFHNAAFDLGWFYKHNFFPDRVYDTMLASMILYNGMPYIRHSFGETMKRELGLLYDKSEQKNIHRVKLSTKEAIEYAFNDVDRLIDLLYDLFKKIEQGGYTEAYKTHCHYVKSLAYMQVCGLPVDEQYWYNKIKKDKQVLEQTQQNVVEYIWEHLPEYRDLQVDLFDSKKHILKSTSSTAQMIEVFEKFGINIQDDKDHTKKTLNKNIIKRSDHEFIKIWLDYKEADHDVTTYGENLVPKIRDGYFYTSFNPIKDTARISTRKNEVNVLNFPANERTRECFRAKEGFTMVVADYEGQENAVLADQSGDKMMIASINEGLDLHCAFARLIFPELQELSDDEIKEKHKDKRQFAKAPRFAKAYGGNGFTIAKNLNISKEEGEKISDLYDELHSGVMEWGEKVLEQAIRTGYIESADGFKLHLPFYDEFMEKHDWFESLNKDFWKSYSSGKKIYQKIKEGREKEGWDEELFMADLSILEEVDLAHYRSNRQKVSSYFKRRSEYFRLCLNNPIQGRSAFQTKRAAALLFNKIIEEGDVWDVKICNIPHDEFVLMVKEEKAEKWCRILEECMVLAGNSYLTSGKVKMQAEAKTGDSWYDAK